MIAATSSAETFGLPVNQSIAFSNHKGDLKERLKKQQLTSILPAHQRSLRAGDGKKNRHDLQPTSSLPCHTPV
jgi:hypothetical protein